MSAVREAKKAELRKKLQERKPFVNLHEKCTVHSKSYTQPSLDRAVKLFQAHEIERTGENVTYSEAMRRLICYGLEDSRAFGGIQYG